MFTKADLNDDKARNRKISGNWKYKQNRWTIFFLSTIDVDKPRSSITNFYYNTFVELPLAFLCVSAHI